MDPTLNSPTQHEEMQTSLDAILTQLRKLSADREDDRFILNALSSQGQIQSERLRNLGDQVLANKVTNDNITKNLCLSVETSIKSGIDQLNASVKDLVNETRTEKHEQLKQMGAESQIKEHVKTDHKDTESLKNIVEDIVSKKLSTFEENITAKLNSINSTVQASKTEILEESKENTIAIRHQIKDGAQDMQEFTHGETNSLLAKLDETKSDLNSDIQNLTAKFSKLESEATQQSDNSVQFESALIHMAHKVKRLTTVTTLRITELNKDIAVLQNIVKGLEQKFDIDMKNQTDIVVTDVKELKGMLQNDVQNKLGQLESKVNNQDVTLKSIDGEFGKKGRLYSMMQQETHSVIDQIVAECQIVREITTNRRKVRDSHTCDMVIYDFNEFVGGTEWVYSRVWYIDHLNTHVKGCILFKSDKTFDVGLVHGRYPRVMGLEAEVGGTVKVTAKLVKLVGQGDDWIIGSKALDTDETNIAADADGWSHPMGIKIGNVNCAEVSKPGFLNNGKAVIRFDLVKE